MKSLGSLPVNIIFMEENPVKEHGGSFIENITWEGRKSLFKDRKVIPIKPDTVGNIVAYGRIAGVERAYVDAVSVDGEKVRLVSSSNIISMVKLLCDNSSA